MTGGLFSLRLYPRLFKEENFIMKLKKIASLALAGVMAVSMLAGCKGGNTVVDGNGNANVPSIVTAVNNGQRSRSPSPPTPPSRALPRRLSSCIRMVLVPLLTMLTCVLLLHSMAPTCWALRALSPTCTVIITLLIRMTARLLPLCMLTLLPALLPAMRTS